MRCKACDEAEGVKFWHGDFYCSSCRQSIMDTIITYPDSPSKHRDEEVPHVRYDTDS